MSLSTGAIRDQQGYSQCAEKKRCSVCEVRTGGATLAAEPEDITLNRICTAVEPDAIDKMIGIHSSPSPFCPVGRKIQSVLDDTYEELKKDVIASMKSITLDKILADYHDKQQKSQ